MNKLKNFIAVFLIVLCTGCDIKYNVSFQQKNVKENIEISNLKFNNDNILMSPVEFFFQKKIYNYRYNNDTLFAEQSFYDLNNYMDGSLMYYFVPDGIIKNGNVVNINLKTNDQISEYISNFGNIDSIELSLYIPYYVSSHNASSVNDNTYTWKIDNLEDANIKINFDISKSNKYIQNIISIVIIGVLVAIILFIIIFLYIKNKKNNEI